jgi:hypothetical protein
VIDLTAAAAGVLGGSYGLRTRVQSWRGGQLLADDVPVVSGTEEVDRTLRVPERVTLSVPRTDRGTSWDPVEADHPLGAYGQRLVVMLGIELGGGEVEWIRRGEYVITNARPRDDTVAVTAAGLLYLIDEARLVSPYQPSGTLASTLRGLLEPALTVVIDPALVDRAVPAAVNFDDDRLGAVLQVLDTWPAAAVVTPDGYLSVVPATTSATPVLSLTDAAGGTVLDWSGEVGRDGACNVVVARGTATDGTQVQGAAYDYSGGPMAYGGPFSPLPVPAFMFSPLLTTVEQCNEAAATTLDRKRREGAPRMTATLVPHPGLQGGDCVAVTGRGLVERPCIVEATTLPLVAGGGPASAQLAVI